MIEALIAGSAGIAGALFGAGVAWGMLRQAVKNLTEWVKDTREGVGRVEKRCQERDEDLSEQVAVVRQDLRDARRTIDHHIASHRNGASG